MNNLSRMEELVGLLEKEQTLTDSEFSEFFDILADSCGEDADRRVQIREEIPAARCTHEEAILYAAAGETVDFAPALSGETISLADAALIADRQLTIDASALAQGITLDGNARSTLIITGGGTENAPTVLRGLTLTDGSSYDGGGILSKGYLQVADSSFNANSGTFGSAVFNFRGNVSISNTTFADNTTG